MSSRDALGGSVGSELDGRHTSLPSRFLSALSAVERELWFATVVVMLLDVTLTIRGLQLGLYELNPVARLAIRRADIFGLYALKSIALGVGACCLPVLPDRYTVVIPLGLILPSAVAVVSNAFLLLAVI